MAGPQFLPYLLYTKIVLYKSNIWMLLSTVWQPNACGDLQLMQEDYYGVSGWCKGLGENDLYSLFAFMYAVIKQFQ